MKHIVITFPSALAFGESCTPGSPQNLGIKLSSIIKRKDTCHEYILNFSFAHLLDAIQNFLEAYLKLHPCDFLLKVLKHISMFAY